MTPPEVRIAYCAHIVRALFLNAYMTWRCGHRTYSLNAYLDVCPKHWHHPHYPPL